MQDRKRDHIELALRAQMSVAELDRRFIYEPLLSAHPMGNDKELVFLGKKFRVPIWVSSMTGGTPMAREINSNLARVCKEFGMGMGLGSCRALLSDERCLPDFDLRDLLGDERAFYANLGIGQIEKSIETGKVHKIHEMVERLRADGLIIHVNPLQEWVQPEGDRLKVAPVVTIERFLEKAPYKIVVKEVGQGMGGNSLRALMYLPIEALEFAAFGGTNFTVVEMMRNQSKKQHDYEPLARVGADAATMLDEINSLVGSDTKLRCRQIIISGGIRNFLDGYYYTTRSKLPSVYGQASVLLKFAREGYESLYDYINNQIGGLRLARSFLLVRD